MTDSVPDGVRRAPLAGLAIAALALGVAAHGQEPAPRSVADPWPDTSAEPALELSPGWRHVGDSETPDWPEAAPVPEAPRFVLEFDAPANPEERALELRAAHVDETWTVSLNGVRLGTLRRGQEPSRVILPVPPGALRDGPDLLVAEPPQPGDDVTIGGVRLLERGYRALLGVEPVPVRVLDAGGGGGIPARLVVLGEDGAAAPLHYAGESGRPTRDGVQYADARGEALLELGPGSWSIHATRGVEWGAAHARVRVPRGAGEGPVTLALAREVRTPGWMSADTHIHTYTFSGHGDATLEERVTTLAGEGVEVAIATDHNHHTDYAPAQAVAGFAGGYLTIVGNEVTTDVGHFNAFPFARGAARPDASLKDWDALDAEIRGRGAQVVILNHPRWPNPEEGPFGVERLDAVTGEFGSGIGLRADGIEIFNSSEPPDRWKQVMTDWFALRNAGSRAQGIASSDSHTVANPVAQGRTYFACPAETPAEADEAMVVAAFRRGATTMSQGLYLEIAVEGAGPGETVPLRGGAVRVSLRVAGAAWASATRADVFLDGRRVLAKPLARADGGPFDHRFEFELPAPPHDAWLVALAQGPAPEGGWWTTGQTHLAAMSNPVYLDGDGDGVWRSPREIAAAYVEGASADPAALGAVLAGHDAAVAIQAAALWRRLPAARAGAAQTEALCAASGPHESLLRRLLLEDGGGR